MIRKRILGCWLFFCCALISCAEQSRFGIKCDKSYDQVRKNEYYSDFDIAPQYPGGPSEMMKYIMKNYRIPENDDFQARFVLEFIVDSKGNLVKPSIMNKKVIDLNASEIEILRVIKEMPKWESAKCGSKLVPAKVLLPMTF